MVDTLPAVNGSLMPGEKRADRDLDQLPHRVIPFLERGGGRPSVTASRTAALAPSISLDRNAMGKPLAHSRPGRTQDDRDPVLLGPVR